MNEVIVRVVNSQNKQKCIEKYLKKGKRKSNFGPKL